MSFIHSCISGNTQNDLVNPTLHLSGNLAFIHNTAHIEMQCADINATVWETQKLPAGIPVVWDTGVAFT